jgi:hypothetical protein
VERKLWRRSILTLDEERIYTVDLGDSSSGRNKYTNDYGVTTFRVLAVGSPIRIISAIHIFTSGYKTERPSSRNPSRRSHRAPLPAALHRGRCRVVPPPSLSVAARRKQQATAFLSLMEVSGRVGAGKGGFRGCVEGWMSHTMNFLGMELISFHSCFREIVHVIFNLIFLSVSVEISRNFIVTILGSISAFTRLLKM